MSGEEEEIKELPQDHLEQTDALSSHHHHQKAPVLKHADAQEHINTVE